MRIKNIPKFCVIVEDDEALQSDPNGMNHMHSWNMGAKCASSWRGAAVREV